MKTSRHPRLSCWLLSVVLATASALAQSGVALVNGNALLNFNVGTAPTGNPVAVTGLGAGETLVGLDYRPANRTLVGLTSGARLVVLNPATGVATALATLNQPLTGTGFGVDFNPVPDRLRVVTNTGLNYRINVDTGAVTVDGFIRYAPTDPGAALSVTPRVSGAGYTNSTATRVPATTALYLIDVGRDVLVLQNPPNDGVLVTVGALGVDATGVAGLDIFAPNLAYASLVVGGQTGLYSINLTTGAATLVNGLPAGVVDLALTLKEPALGLVNTSARGLVAPGEGAVIVGFVIAADGPTNVLVNARGPSLTAFGVVNALADTRVQIYRGATLLADNDDWQTGARAAEVTASGLAPGSPRESAILTSLAPGAYTAVLMGAGAATSGVAIIEVYELP